MRLGYLIIGDMRSQAKSGFYFLYALLTALYVAILLALPNSWVKNTAAILIFSDPAAMGLYFMGAIVLLEKSQHVPCAFAVSPVRPSEYVLSKVISLSAISLMVAAVLALTAGATDIPLLLAGTLLTCMAFTLLGVIVAMKTTGLNQFILWTVPIEAVCFAPAILHLFGITPPEMRHHPVNACMDMVAGRAPSALGAFVAIALVAILMKLSIRCVSKLWGMREG